MLYQLATGIGNETCMLLWSMSHRIANGMCSYTWKSDNIFMAPVDGIGNSAVGWIVIAFAIFALISVVGSMRRKHP